MKKFEEDMAGGDLDIPGSELDDADRKRRWRKPLLLLVGITKWFRGGYG
jgi:hypothetical protein